MRHETRTLKVEWFATGILFLGALAAPLASASRSLSHLPPARAVIGIVDSAVSPRSGAHLKASGSAILVSQRVLVPVNPGADPPPVRVPPWWSGPCDDGHYPGSFALSSWDGLTACGPGPNRGGYDSPVEFFPGAWGELEWECVELSMRWLYLEYGVRPYGANGSGVVWNYSRADGGDLDKVANDGSSVPRPGDVISMGSGWSEGHTAVVTGVDVTNGYGTISILEQNMNGGDGTNTLGVFKNVVEPDYDMPVTGWLQAATFRTVAAEPAISPAADLVLDGGFNHRGPGAWHKAGRSHFLVELPPTPPRSSATAHWTATANTSATVPYEGYGFAVTDSSSQGGGIYQDIAFPVSTGDSFCADAEVVTAGATSGARGNMTLWLLGGAVIQHAKAPFGPLRGGDGWAPVSSCVTATSAHSDIRIQFYDAPHTAALGIDAVDVHESFVSDGGFDHRDRAGWHSAPHSWLGIEPAGALGTMPYSGNGFAVTNSAAASGGIYEDVALPLAAGDTLCADAEVVSVGANRGARGKMVLSLTGESRTERSFVSFGRLAARSRWTPVSTCVTATASHSGFRIEISDAPKAPTLGVDDVDVHQSFVANGGFGNYGGSGWHKAAHTWFESEPAGRLDTDAYEGSGFGATSSRARGGGIYQFVSLPVRAGESLCAVAEVVSVGAHAGAAGSMSLTLSGRSPSQSSLVSFGPLPAKGGWTAVSTCVTSAGTHSGFKIQFHDAPGAPPLGIDAVDVR